MSNELLAAMRRYVRHDVACAAMAGVDREKRACSCGLAELLQRLTPEPRP